MPFARSYSAFQLLSAIVGWQLGAALGPGPIGGIVARGPGVALGGGLGSHAAPDRVETC